MAWMAAPTLIRPLPNGILLFNWRKRLAIRTWSSVFWTKRVDASRSRFPILVWRGARRSPIGILAASWVSCATISFNGLEHASTKSTAYKWMILFQMRKNPFNRVTVSKWDNESLSRGMVLISVVQEKLQGAAWRWCWRYVPYNGHSRQRGSSEESPSGTRQIVVRLETRSRG